MGQKKRSPRREGVEEEVEEEEETKETTILTSLFAASNPFRRNSSSSSNKKLRKGKKTDRSISPPTQEEREEEDRSNKKKKHKKHGNKKRDEIEGVEKENPNGDYEDSKKDNNRRQKRKRDEIEFLYEMRRCGQTSAAERDERGEEENPNGEEKEEEKAIATVIGEKRKKAEEGKEKGEFDSEEKLLRTVFVGNLPFGTKRKTLVRDFSSSFGEVESIRIRSVPIAPDTKAPRKAAVIKGKVNEAIGSVHAYVVFKGEESARAALAHNMMKFGGNHIRVDKACPPRKKMKGEAPFYSVKKTVFVGNLPFDVKDEEIYQLFCDEHQMESSVEAVRVIRDPQTSLGKGIAYVMFKTREAANSVVKKRGIKLRDRELRVSHARTDSTPSSTPSKRKMESHGAVHDPSKHTSNSSRQADSKPTVTASSSSYQGLRSSKTGRPKKAPKVKHPGSTDSRQPKRSETARQQKRPAVAARKANSQKQAQKKRKLDGGTPENPNWSKKTRFF